jgi:hypothetical protein
MCNAHFVCNSAHCALFSNNMKLIVIVLIVLVPTVHSDELYYTIRAIVEKPNNISLAGEVGQECLSLLVNWHPPTKKENPISFAELISVLPRPDLTISVGDVFKVPLESLFFKLLAQIHPGARVSRYDPLDPNSRASSSAYGILQSAKYDELRFLFR